MFFRRQQTRVVSEREAEMTALVEFYVHWENYNRTLSDLLETKAHGLWSAREDVALERVNNRLDKDISAVKMHIATFGDNESASTVLDMLVSVQREIVVYTRDHEVVI